MVKSLDRIRVAALSAIAVPAVAIALVAPSSALAAGGSSGGVGLGGGTSSSTGSGSGSGSGSSSTPGPSGGAGLTTGSSSSKSSSKSTSSAKPTQTHASNKTTPTKSSGTEASGDIVGLSWASFTVRTGSQRMAVVQALIDAANAMNGANYPYVWAGGHPAAGAASVGTSGPGYTGHTLGFDCSGSVAAILSSGDLWQPGTPVPADNGVIAQLHQEGLITRGVGTGSTEVTLYDDPGVHIFMNIDGRFFGTGANAKGGPGWLGYDGVSRAFKPWHFVASALRATTTYGSELTFGVGSGSNLLYGLSVGQRVQVHYKKAKSGALTATAVSAG
jgi:hypothetical protein